MVAYGRIKIIGNSTTVFQKSGRGRLRERKSFYQGCNRGDLTGKILVFWIGGRLWEVVAL